jgi:uncharacterized membrane protein
MPAWVDFFLSGVCHQLPGHAIDYGGQVAPLCARCTGMFSGALLMLVMLGVSGARERSGLAPWYAQGVFLSLAVWWALDGLNAFAYGILGRPVLYEPLNALRLVTGMGMGLALAGEIWPIAVQVLAKVPDARPALDRPAQLLGLLAVGGAGALLFLSERFPWAAVAGWSIAGVATLMVGANTLLLALLTGVSGATLRGWRLAGALSGGMLMALAETGGLALLRRLAGS